MTEQIPVTIETGQFWLEIACPQCTGTEHVLIELSGRLIVDDESSAIRARLKSKSADHICNQLSLTVTPPAGDPLPFDTEAEA